MSTELIQKPSDFDTYWNSVDAELAALDAAPELERMPGPSTEEFTTYRLRLTSIGPYRIFGYLSVPAGDGPFPGLLQTPRYGSVNHIPDYNDRLRYVVLQLVHRGQRLADSLLSVAYPGLLTMGIDDPSTFIYRAIVADCLRGAEYLLAHPSVDRRRVGIVGDDLAIITAARRPGISGIVYEEPMLYRAAEAYPATDAYPLEEINDYLRGNPGSEEAVNRSLAYVDPIHHAGSTSARLLLSVPEGGAEWLDPLAQAHGGAVNRYELTHRSGIDNDWKDSWLAGLLGVPAMTRFRREV
jgi:cephalosporin-C deacetylase